MEIIKGSKKLIVTEKAFRVVYKDLGYKPFKEKEVLTETPTPEAPKDEDANGQGEGLQEPDVDFLDLSEEELQKVNNDDLKAYLDKMEIEYKSKATKEELINLIKG